MFIMHLGLSHAFRAGASSTVRVREFHTKFIHEALPGDGLRIETAMTALDDDCLSLIHLVWHADGRVAATVHEKLEHIYLRTGQSFDWPKRLMIAAADFTVDLPDMAKPKGLPENLKMTGANLETLQKWNCSLIGRGVFTKAETDLFNTVSPQSFVGRLSDSVVGFKEAWPSMQDGDWRETGLIGVMLETQYRFHNYVEAGMPYLIYSGIGGVSEKVRQLIHHFVNPFTGLPYISAVAVNGLIDLNTRKLVVPDADLRKRIEAHVLPNLHG